MTTSLSATIEKDEVQETLIAFFDIITEESVNMSCTITDNWLENNTAVQDAIALNPIIVTLRGLVGEVVFKTPHRFADGIVDKINNIAGFNVTNKLNVIPSLLPAVDNYTQIARNALDYAENTYNKVKDVIDKIKGKGTSVFTNQAVLFGKLKLARALRTPCRLRSSYGLFNNMYIQDVNIGQTTSVNQSELSVTLKQLNFADSVTYAEADKAVMDKYMAYATSEFENNGKAAGKRKTILASMWDSTK